MSEHTYAAIPRAHLLFNSNSLIIVNDQFLTVTDANTSPLVTKGLLKQIRDEVSTLPVRYVIITHGHDDHAFGIAGYKQVLGSSVEVVAHENIRTHLQEAHERKRFLGADRLEEGSALIRKSGDKGKLPLADSIDFWLNDVVQTTDTLTYPDKFISVDTAIGSGKDKIEIYVRSGHSRGDLVIYYPAEKVIATGDLVHGYDPLMFPGYNAVAWIATLKFIDSLPIRFHVGGHGDYFEDKTEIKLWKNYLEEIVALVRKSKSDGISAEKLIEQIVKGQIVVKNRDSLTRIPFKHVPKNVHHFYLGHEDPFANVKDHINALYRDLDTF